MNAPILLMLWLMAGTSTVVNPITATFETTASPYPEDSVDDVAIWPHPENANQSLIVGTLKASNLRPVQPTGLLLFDLSGQQLQFLEGGTPNNVDLRAGFPFTDGSAPIIGTGHWWSNDVTFYRIQQQQLVQITTEPFTTGLDKLQGFCLGKQPDSEKFHYVVVNKEGQLEHYHLNYAGQRLSSELIGQFALPSQAEGCVIDDANQVLYVAEENAGIWQFRIDESGLYQFDQGRLIDQVGSHTGLAPDVEGLAIYPTGKTSGYLLASSQQISRFFVYDRNSTEFITSFQVTDGDHIDGVSHTDGLDVSPTPYNPVFPRGILVTQDNDNVDGSQLRTQNFKIISWEPVQQLIEQAIEDQDS